MNDSTSPPAHGRGFARSSVDQRTAIARQGGRRVQELGNAHRLTSETGRAAAQASAKSRAAAYMEVIARFPSLTRDARQKFMSQSKCAAWRGIAWEFTFEQWCEVWHLSGKWSERGRSGYVMARHRDEGPYAPHNVYITTGSQNVRDFYALKRPVKRGASLGKGKGWRISPRLRTKPYEVRVRDKSIGHFATQAEAEAAYRDAVAFIQASEAA